MIWLILVGIIVLLVVSNYATTMRHFKKMGVKQTKPWPILGDLWATLFRVKSFGEVILAAYNLHPNTRYVGFYQFSLPTLIIKDLELIKQIAVKDFDFFTDHRSTIDPEVDPLWSKNLVSLKGQKWREMRATLSGLFTSSKMKHMFGIINEAAENFTQYFLDRRKDLIELEMKDTFTRYTNDVIATTAFGIQVNSLAEPQNTFYRMGKVVTDFGGFLVTIKLMLSLVAPKIFSFFKLSVMSQEPVHFFRNIINETITVREEKGIVRQDLINLLLETRKGNKDEEADVIDTGFATATDSTQLDKYKFKQLTNLSNDDIVAQSLVFFFAGFDTISTALCFGTYELALNKDIQDRLRKEIQETHKANNGKLTYETLLKMKYMDMVFTEILRKWPPVVVMDRVCTKPYTIEPVYPDEKPVHLKVGDVLFLPFLGLHRDPKYYPEPDKFDPERFSDENKDNITPYTFVPFGAGPRNCIGSRFAILEAKAVLYHLLMHFEIVPTKQTSIPLKLSTKNFQNTAEGGFWLGLRRVKD